MDSNIRSVVKTALSGVSGITGGIYYGRTYETPTDPYVVFFEFSNSSFRDTEKTYEEIFIQFSCFDKAVNPKAIETIANSIYDTLNGASLVFTNYNCFSCLGWRRPFVLVADDQYWQMITEIRLWLEPK
jgi:hypothetical protein